jgi:hypothetical protein
MSNIMFAAVHTCLILVQLSGKRALSVHVFLFIPMRHIVRSLYLRRRPRSINAHSTNKPKAQGVCVRAIRKPRLHAMLRPARAC